MNIHYQGIWRMDWGFGNPNTTAAFIVLLMIAVWWLPLIRKWMFWVSLAASIGLGLCLLHTMSRGGIVAASIAFALIAWRIPRPWPSHKVLAIAMGIVLVLTGSIYLQTTSRVTDNWKDRSITNRMQIWKCAPRMMVDAPYGWGIGNAAKAFSSWYQPLDWHDRYKHLVNGHLTLLVELNWPMRFLYTFGWFAVFVLCYLQDKKPQFALSLGAWAVFFITNTFGMVTDIFLMWVIPCSSLLGILFLRLRRRIWPTRLEWSGCGCLALIVLGIFYMVGCFSASPNITVARNGAVYVNGTSPKFWIVVGANASPSIISDFFPRNLREYLHGGNIRKTVGIAASPEALPSLSGDKLGVIGALSKEQWQTVKAKAYACQKLVLVSPDVSPADLNFPEDLLLKTSVIFGEFSTKASMVSWKNATKNYSQLDGVGDFLQNWPEIVFSATK